MIDHHVDRLDVDAQQCVKLTSTNRSIGLILAPSHAAINGLTTSVPHKAGTLGCFLYSCIPVSTIHDIDPASARAKARASFFFDDLVVIARGNTPDPIPNSAVKTLSADGTPS